MNGKERICAALAFQPSDYAAVNPEIIQHSLEIAGVTHRAYSTDPKVLAQAQLACQAHYGYDAVYVSSDNYIFAEAMGASVRFPEDEPPQLIKKALTDENVSALPALTADRGRISVILEATRLCRESLGDEIFVKTCIDSAPFSAAAALAGPQDFLMALCDEEDWVMELLEFCTEQITRFGILAAEAGAHGLAFGDSVASLVSPDMYRLFALPYAQKVIRRLKEKTGLPVFYHVCGNTNHILDLMVTTGADCLELDSPVDFEKARALAAGHCCLEGNVSTIEALLQGTPADVRREANCLLDLFGNRGGLILSGACEIPRHSPRDNVAALVSAAREYSY